MIHLVAQPFALALGHAPCAASARPRAAIALSTVVIHQGDASLPPLVEADASPLPFGRIVKPPDADTYAARRSGLRALRAQASRAACAQANEPRLRPRQAVAMAAGTGPA